MYPSKKYHEKILRDYLETWTISWRYQNPSTFINVNNDKLSINKVVVQSTRSV